MTDDAEPKVFISYSWSSPDHEAWVVKLAEEMAEAGVHPVLDKWDLREGDDAGLFMERMVNDPEIKKVILGPVVNSLMRRRCVGTATPVREFAAEERSRFRRGAFFDS